MIRLLAPFNGHPTGSIMNTGDSNTEAALVAAGLASYDTTGGLRRPYADPFDDSAFHAPLIVAQDHVPTIVLSSGTITATGALSSMTAGVTPVGLVPVIVAADAGLTGGMMWARFTSTTACQLYTDPAGTIRPAGLTAGAYTGETGTTNALKSVIIPGGLMGPNGSIRITVLWGANTAASTKAVAVSLGGTAIATATMANSTGNLQQQILVRNTGTEKQQTTTAVATLASFSNATGANIRATIDTSAPMTLAFTGGHATATDWVSLESYVVEVLYGF